METGPAANGVTNGNGGQSRPDLPWKAAAGTLGSGAAGAGGAFWLHGASPLQVVSFLAIWALLALAGVTAYIARQWIDRRVLHAQELIELHRLYRDQLAAQGALYREQIERILAAALKRERELEADRAFLQGSVRDSAHLAASAVVTAVQQGARQPSVSPLEPDKEEVP